MSHSITHETAQETDGGLQPAAQVPSPLAAHAATLLSLQRSAGNAAVVGMLQRSAHGGGAMLQRDPVPAPACDPATEAAVEAFKSQSYSVEDHHPTTGRGLFDAEYRAADGVLAITLGIAFDFLDGSRTDPTWVASVGGPVKAATYTADQFTWTDSEKEDWKANAIAQVLALWSGRYTFYIQRPCWESLPPVNVSIAIVDRPASGAGKAHFVTSVTKWPTEPGLEESVTPPGATADQSTARFQESGANGITNPDVDHYSFGPGARAKYGEATRDNPGTINFPLGKDEVSGPDKTKLRTFGATLAQPYMPPFPVTLTGHSSSEGSDESNMTLSEGRARNVSNEIVGAKKQPTVVGQGETGATADPVWRRVDITLGKFESDQTTVAHEFGHMFGLGDEYPTDDGGTRDVGTPVAHSKLATDLIPGQQPIVATHNENIMSTGTDVKPHHYVTFLEVLGIMTASAGEWDIKPAPPVQGPGDFPTPAPGGPVVV